MNGARPTHAVDSDEALIAGVVDGDTLALEALFDRYSSLVFAVARRVVGPQEADEVVQDVFVRVWTRATQFDSARGRFDTWLFAITRHRIRDSLRRLSASDRLASAEAIEALASTIPDPGDSPEDLAWQRERRAAVSEALASLPLEQRRAITLAYFSGMTQASISSATGWPLGTVKKRIRLGLQKLRAGLPRSWFFSGTERLSGDRKGGDR